MKLHIIIPVRNEEEIIEETLCILEKRLNIEKTIIVVNDYSTDRTSDVVRDIIEKNHYNNIKLIFNKGKKGFGNALKKGFDVTEKESVIIPIMGDLCDQIELIAIMYNKILEGFDVICASRYTKGGRRKGGPILKNIISKWVSKILNWVIKIPVTDVCNSFKMYRKDVLDNIDITSEGFEISMEIIIKAYFAGYKIAEIPTIWQERKRGMSKFRLLKNSRKYMKWFFYAVSKREIL